MRSPTYARKFNMSLIGYYKGTLVWDTRAIGTAMGEKFADYVEKAWIDPDKRFAFASVGNHIEANDHPFVTAGVEQLINKLRIHGTVNHEEVKKALEYTRKGLGDEFIIMTKDQTWFNGDGGFFKAGQFPIATGTGCYHFIAACLFGEDPLKAATIAGRMDSLTSSVVMQLKHQHLKPFEGTRSRKPAAKKTVATKKTPVSTRKKK